LVRSHGIDTGRTQASELERRYGAQPVVIDELGENALLFFIHKKYSPTMSEQELYDSTRQFWYDVSQKTRTTTNHRLALAVVESVIVRAYSIEGWYPAGTTFSSRKLTRKPIKRWEFVGQLLEDYPLNGRLLVDESGNRIPASQNGYRYINFI